MIVDSDFDITVLRVVSANRLYNTPAAGTVCCHGRKRWAVVLKSGGKTYYTVNGQQILSDSLHPVILPRGCDYSWKCTEPGECLIVDFEAVGEGADIYSFTVLNNTFFRTEFMRIRKLLSDGGNQMECICRLYGLLLQLRKSVAGEYVPKKKQSIIQPAVEYISENYDQVGITNDQLAEICGISTVYFRKCFATIYGVSPIRYVNDVRIRKAKEMLSSDYGNIRQVAESVGYSNVYHFSKMFKIHTGISPGQYVKSGKR